MKKRWKREDILIEVGAWVLVFAMIGWVIVAWN